MARKRRLLKKVLNGLKEKNYKIESVAKFCAEIGIPRTSWYYIRSQFPLDIKNQLQIKVSETPTIVKKTGIPYFEEIASTVTLKVARYIIDVVEQNRGLREEILMLRDKVKGLEQKKNQDTEALRQLQQRFEDVTGNRKKNIPKSAAIVFGD